MLIMHARCCFGRMEWVSEGGTPRRDVPYEIRFTHKKSRSVKKEISAPLGKGQRVKELRTQRSPDTTKPGRDIIRARGDYFLLSRR